MVRRAGRQPLAAPVTQPSALPRQRRREVGARAGSGGVVHEAAHRGRHLMHPGAVRVTREAAKAKWDTSSCSRCPLARPRMRNAPEQATRDSSVQARRETSNIETHIDRPCAKSLNVMSLPRDNAATAPGAWRMSMPVEWIWSKNVKRASRGKPHCASSMTWRGRQTVGVGGGRAHTTHDTRHTTHDARTRPDERNNTIWQSALSKNTTPCMFDGK
jgi:hypothetical protein